jgi:hypothetical protein
VDKIKVLLVEDNDVDVLLIEEFFAEIADVKFDLTIAQRLEEAVNYVENGSVLISIRTANNDSHSEFISKSK